MGALTPGEIRTLLDGIDWMTDREWERLVFVKTTDARAAKDMFTLAYPRFRNEKKRVVQIIHAPTGPRPARRSR